MISQFFKLSDLDPERLHARTVDGVIVVDGYFINIDQDYGFLSHSKEETIGTNDPLKSFSMMTPQLSIVENGYVKETYIGVDEILNIIE